MWSAEDEDLRTIQNEENEMRETIVFTGSAESIQALQDAAMMWNLSGEPSITANTLLIPDLIEAFKDTKGWAHCRSGMPEDDDAAFAAIMKNCRDALKAIAANA